MCEAVLFYRNKTSMYSMDKTTSNTVCIISCLDVEISSHRAHIGSIVTGF